LEFLEKEMVANISKFLLNAVDNMELQIFPYDKNIR
jgi:hypothetical protein